MNQQRKLTWNNGRAFSQYENWEDYAAGFYARCGCKDKSKAELSANLMRDNRAFYLACKEVLEKWPITSLVHLTNTGINHKAWIGHASNYLHHRTCEECTVKGWHMLNQKEQNSANRVANKAVREWLQCESANYRPRNSQLALMF